MYKKAAQRQQDTAHRSAYYAQNSSNDDGTLAGLVALALASGVIWGAVKVVQGSIWVGKKFARIVTKSDDYSKPEEQAEMK